MRTAFKAAGLAFALVFIAWAPPVGAAPLTVAEVAREMICDCPDCGKQSLEQCADCSKGKAYRAEIKSLLDKGASKQEVLDHFATTYGEHMLGNPRARGTGLLAKSVPFAAVGLGLVPIFLLLRKRARTRATARAPRATSSVSAAPPSDDPRVHQALSKFDY